MTSNVTVHMKTCSKTHYVSVSMRDDGDLDVSIKSDCPHVREYAEKLKVISVEDATSFSGSKIVDPDVRISLSAPCLVPNAVFDAAWMELGMLSKSLCEKVKGNDLVFEQQNQS